MSDKVIVILLIAAIILSVLSIALTISFNLVDSNSAKSNLNERDSASANVGLTIGPTEANGGIVKNE